MNGHQMRSAFSDRDRVFYWIFVILWILVTIVFWSWWLQFAKSGNILLFIAVSLAFFYDSTLLPSFFFYYLGKMKYPVLPALHNKSNRNERVAIITLTVPGSESLAIVERQLKAMQKVSYPHDNWILVDKSHSEEIKELAKKYDCKYFSRHDIKKWGVKKIEYWNQPIPPFKEKTKAGNVNAWLDEYGKNYTIFTQLDIDHRPIANYLDEVLPYFYYEKIAWVQAPSVYGNYSHWTARGSSEQELVLQGPLQMGFYGATQTPFIIGSHCTYRMSAVQEIGGFQPTRAEDHLDTLYLSAHGYRGVFIPKIIAIGDGPENFETYLAQQFAWAFSLMQVLLFHTPKAIKKLPFSIAVQMLFSQTWYPLWSLSMCILFFAPIISLLSNQQIAAVNFWEFLIRSWLLVAVALSTWIWSRKWQQPKGLFISWRSVVLHMARWVIVLSAIIQAALRVKKPYMITQKGTNGAYYVNIKAIQPYIFLSILAIYTSMFYILLAHKTGVQAYLLYTLEETLLMIIVAATPILAALRISKTLALSKHKSALSIIGLSIILFVLCTYLATPFLSTAYLPHTTQHIATTSKKLKSLAPRTKVVTHIVKLGDSLWTIAKTYYGNGICWQQIENPRSGKLIIHGDKLMIVDKDNDCRVRT